jgi:hypothetical protein
MNYSEPSIILLGKAIAEIQGRTGKVPYPVPESTNSLKMTIPAYEGDE